MKRYYLTTLSWLASAGLGAFGTAIEAEEEKPVILFIAGEPSHGWNEHEFPEGCEVLANCLNESGLKIEAKVSLGWPGDTADLLRAAAIVLYSDGGEKHVAKGKTEQLRDLHQQGTGICVLHYSLEPASEEMADFLLDSIGGYFEVNWSVNPIWHMSNPSILNHKATSAVGMFKMRDEWYYHMRFREDNEGITPLLQALPPLSSLGEDGPRSGNPTIREKLKSGASQTLAWTYEDSEKRRGFATTGGHFLYNWRDDSFRKLVLNGIAWAASLAIPQNGISSSTQGLIKYKMINQSIAVGDLEDIKSHIERDPEIIDDPGKSKMTPLHQAVLRKKEDVAELLLNLGAKPNIPTGNGQTALHLAINRGLPSVCALLITKGADLNAQDENGWTPLHLAAAKDRIDIARILIESGANLQILSTAGGTPLHEAAPSASAEMAQLLLDSGIDPMAKSNDGKTALDHAITYKNEAVIQLLESAGQ